MMIVIFIVVFLAVFLVTRFVPWVVGFALAVMFATVAWDTWTEPRGPGRRLWIGIYLSWAAIAAVLAVWVVLSVGWVAR